MVAENQGLPVDKGKLVQRFLQPKELQALAHTVVLVARGVAT
jgi:hypothetical protein